jgi:beta-lactamase class A
MTFRTLPYPTLILLAATAAGCAAPAPRAAGPVATAPAASVAPAAHTDTVLEGRIRALMEGFRGDAGVYVRHLGTGATVALRADETYPTASMIKVPILIALYDGVEAGRWRLSDVHAFPDSLRRDDGEDVVKHFRDGSPISLEKLAFLSISLSDNTASVWLQRMVGGGDAINAWLDAHGFRTTRMNSRTPGREAAWREYGWGQTSPREIAELLVMIREGRAVSPTASERMYRTLTAPYWYDRGLSALPPTVQVASKQGWVSRSRSEVMLVNGATGDYVLAVITRNQEDRDHDRDNPGYVLLREVSRTVYRHFNPTDPWEPRPVDPRYEITDA